MERGIYFDGWFPRHHNYHPSLPARRLRMIDDLVEYRATMLVWAALGGGSISLPYLEQEASQAISSRLRLYGFVNDREFIAECHKRGIKVFGIEYEVQGWEFPIELNEEEDRILSMNELRGVGKRGWMGLREFSQNRYPKLWPPFEEYFPGGLVNSDGEPVADLLEEAASRDIHGEPIHTDWVECPDRDHFCYQMDRNNPVWREYLKAVIRIQIDAGVDGMLLDTPESPLISVWYGGCFCKDCMKGFRSYVQALPDRPPELTGVDLTQFHYGKWLLQRGYNFKTDRESTPLFWDYVRFQRQALVANFGELADYARAYGARKGRAVMVSGNFYELFPHFHPIEPKVDVLVTEMRNTSYRQPAWYRYAAGFAGEKPVVVIENPLQGVTPKLVESLKAGRGYDLFRMLAYEAAALGVNLSIPYGAWLGPVIQDSFYAPHELPVEVQSFLAENEELFSSSTYSELGVVFSVESNLRLPLITNFQLAEMRGPSGPAAHFWAVSESLCDAGQPFDVVMFPDGTLRADTVTSEQLLRYRALILPDCQMLTDTQAAALAGYLEMGKWIVVLGELGGNLSAKVQRRILRRPRAIQLDGASPFHVDTIPYGPQVSYSAKHDLMINLQRLRRGVSVHIIRYDYDEVRDAVPVLPSLELKIRLPRPFFRVAPRSPEGALEATLETAAGEHRLFLRNVPLYSILELR